MKLVFELLRLAGMKKLKSPGWFFAVCLTSSLFFLRCGGCDESMIVDGDLAGTFEDGFLGAPADLTGVNLDGGVVITTDGGTRVCNFASCQGKIYACGDCGDNDGDGRFDSDDPDCLGPCDNTESGALTLGIPGGNNAPCKADCYFDQDTGTGNDSCFWDHSCDPKSVAPNYYPESHLGNRCAYVNNPSSYTVGGGLTCTTAQQGQSSTCNTICSPLVPNACDCFGCCAIGPQANTATTPKQGIWLGSQDANKNGSCTLGTLGDPAKCHPCTIVEACFKGCGPCQYCLGDPPDKVFPPTCFQSLPDMAGSTDMAGVNNCPAFLCTESGKQACAPSGSGFNCAPCPAGTFCNTGCCQPTVG